MDENLLEAKIFHENLAYYGIETYEFNLLFAKKVVSKIEKIFPKNNTFSVICGLGGNGADGIAVALELARDKKNKVDLFVIGRVSNSPSSCYKSLFEEYKALSEKNSNCTFKQEAYSEDISNNGVIIEALVGTGLVGDKLTKRYKDVISRVSHFGRDIIALDIPSPHYRPSCVFSINYPKHLNAEVIEIPFNFELNTLIGIGEVNALWKPNLISHKKKNGNLVVLADEIEDKITNSTINTYFTNNFIFKFENHLQSIEAIKDLEEGLLTSNVVLISDYQRNIVKDAVVNEVALRVFDKKIVIANSSLCELQTNEDNEIILVIDRSELKKVNFNGKTLSEGGLPRFCIENGVNIVLLGSTVVMVNKKGQIKYHVNKQPFKTDLKLRYSLLLSAMLTKNDTWLAIRASVFTICELI